MSDTTIKVDARVRDRLAVLAAERGSTIRQVVEEFATSTPTAAEQAAVYVAALAHVREHFCPDLDDEGLAAAEWFWNELRAGRTPAALDGRIGEPAAG